MTERRLPPWINCGTVLAAAGFLFFALFAAILLQGLCAGPTG